MHCAARRAARAVALSVVLAGAGVGAGEAAAVTIDRKPLLKLWPGKPAPFDCNISRHRFILDETEDGCGGYSDLDGPGWQASYKPGAINRVTHYITRTRQDFSEKATWMPTIRVPGRYEVWVNWRASRNRAHDTVYYVFTDEVRKRQNTTFRYHVDQHLGWARFSGMQWAKLGTHLFRARRAQNRDLHPRRTPSVRGYVMVLNGPDHSESVDAVGLRFLGPVSPRVTRASTADPRRIELRWWVRRGMGTTAYEIRRLNTVTRQASTLRRNSSALRFLDFRATPGQRYAYWVRAVGGGKRSPWSPRANGIRPRVTATAARGEAVVATE